ncbi:hypothetical protein COJ27_29845 [Bacillus cereus]|uniref:ABC transporter permease n=1 Tax=Bacillus cereus TaxID=1396 RepID=UPI000BFA62B6|nr:ABC-2 family transporter protein [Bacillus cereus]PFL57206.1 hypothetical protein COJ27_29845 [Bacillus cereus]
MQYFKILYQKTIVQMLQYRGNYIFSLIFSATPLLIAIFVWDSADISTQTGYNTKTIVLYYVLGLLIYELTFPEDIQWDFSNEIKMGKIEAYLTTPIDSRWRWITIALGRKSSSIYGRIPLLLLILVFMFKYHENLNGNLIIWLFIILLVLVLQILIALTVSCFTFWTQEVAGVYFFLITLSSFFSGRLFPLDLLPGKVEVLFRWTPFYYTMYFPVSYLLNPQGNHLIDFIGLVLWIIILFLLMGILWKKGLKKYNGAGG